MAKDTSFSFLANQLELKKSWDLKKAFEDIILKGF